ncbi:acyltransferase 3 [Stanieria cyanosphaera PCC 7437]|uniref:Acyltransferase 3 n=1 Tax=Stanieria cyanosphaera (strain ATCC 29371 / PCC 7437) TaxID=111780 RepID=K9XUM4_STAC7|nr:acyltransferase [Stanieria cyanosphaera]AFZ35781.1 acyltransferase 3 [Stanieria cyanosphaera PCC 7437]
MSSKYIKSFDGLRAIAIILVVLGHAKNTIHIQGSVSQYVTRLIANSNLGVRLFFVLSGYLITMLLLKEIQINKTVNIKSFHQKRAIRIFPVCYFFILIVFILNIICNWNVSLKNFLAAATFTWNYQGLWNHTPWGAGNWFLGHLWTLSLEAQFYLIWPIILGILGIYKSRYFALFIIILLPFIRLASYFLFPAQRGLLGMMFHTAIDSIMVGCYIAIINNYKHDFLKKVLTNIFKHKNIFLGFLVLWLFLISPTLGYMIRGFGISIGITIDAIASGLLIAWLHNNPSTAISKFLGNAILVYIGKISYSLYLWQQLFLTDLNTTFLGQFPYNIGFSFLAAIISYYLIEKPFLKLKPKTQNSIITQQSS